MFIWLFFLQCNFQRHTVSVLLSFYFLPPLWVSHFLSGPLPVAGNNITALQTDCMSLCFICFCLKTRKPPFSIDLRFKVAQGLFVFSKWISVQQTHETSLPGNNCHATPPSIKPLSNFPTLSAPLVPPFHLSQLQLLHSSVRVWEGAPDCRRVRIAQDVTAEPASADQCRSLWQREPGWLLPQPQQQQQQLHQHQERDTVRLAMATLSHVSLPVRISKYLCFYLFVSVWA